MTDKVNRLTDRERIEELEREVKNLKDSHFALSMTQARMIERMHEMHEMHDVILAYGGINNVCTTKKKK